MKKDNKTSAVFDREEALKLIKKTRESILKETKAISGIYEGKYIDTMVLLRKLLFFSGALSDGSLLLLIQLLATLKETEGKWGFYAPVEDLKKNLGVCRATIWRRFKELEEKGVISKPKRHHRKDQLGVFNTYNICNLDNWWKTFGKKYKKFVLEKRNLQCITKKIKI